MGGGRFWSGLFTLSNTSTQMPSSSKVSEPPCVTAAQRTRESRRGGSVCVREGCASRVREGKGGGGRSKRAYLRLKHRSPGDN